MLHLGRVRLALMVPILGAFALAEQVQYSRLKPHTIEERLHLYKGDDRKREATLLELLSQAGCANLSEQPVPHWKQPNIICVLPGSTPGVIVVGAHFDHVARGDGIVDNWSGASLLPSLFQSVAASPRRHTFIFVAFTSEEDGLIGSAFYVSQLTKDQLSKIEAMINLDSLGLGPTEVWVSQSDPVLVNRLVVLAHSMKLPISGMNMDGFGKGDEESFIRKKVCTISVHSITPETAHVLHRSDDNITAISFHDYYDTYQLLAFYLAAIDTVPVQAAKTCNIRPL